MTKKIELEALSKEREAPSVERREKLLARVAREEEQLEKLNERWGAEKARRKRLNTLKAELENARIELEKAVLRGDFTRAGEVRENVA